MTCASTLINVYFFENTAVFFFQHFFSTFSDTRDISNSNTLPGTFLYMGVTETTCRALHNIYFGTVFLFSSGGRWPPDPGTARGLGLSAKLDRQNRFFTYADSVYRKRHTTQVPRSSKTRLVPFSGTAPVLVTIPGASRPHDPVHSSTLRQSFETSTYSGYNFYKITTAQGFSFDSRFGNWCYRTDACPAAWHNSS